MSNPMLWVGYPRSYTAGRARPVQYVVLHYTAGSEGPSSAEGGAQYDKNRTDGTSCHAFFDSQGPGLQEVPFGDRSHSAFFYGNEIGVHYEICGTVQTRAQWLDPVSLATLRTCAAAVAYACDTLGLPRRRLSVDEVRAAYNAPAGQRPAGICDHAAITAAYGLGDHTDVGTEFPWDVFMQMVAGVNPSPGPLPPFPEDDMPKLLRVNQTGLTLLTNGPTWYRLPSPAAVEAAKRIWGITGDPTPIDQADLVAAGADVSTFTGGGGGGGGGGATLAQITAAVREELDNTHVPSVPGQLTVA